MYFGSNANICIETKLSFFDRVVLDYIGDKENKENINSKPKINISFYFGENMGQAKSFYREVNYNDIENLIENKWEIGGNLNLSYFATKLIWYGSKDPKKYFEYWTNKGKDKIRRLKKEDMRKLLEELNNDGIIDAKELGGYDSYFTNTKREEVNINPAFYIRFSIDYKDAVEKDKKEELTNFIRDKIKEGLSVMGGEEKLKFLK